MALMCDNVLLVFVFGFQTSYVGSMGLMATNNLSKKTALITPDGNTADQTVLMVKGIKYSGNMTKV